MISLVQPEPTKKEFLNKIIVYYCFEFAACLNTHTLIHFPHLTHSIGEITGYKNPSKSYCIEIACLGHR